MFEISSKVHGSMLMGGALLFITLWYGEMLVLGREFSISLAMLTKKLLKISAISLSDV